MAHNIEIKKGVASFASTQKAWHGLGQIVTEAMTAEQAIKLAHLDYEVAKVPNYALINGVFQPTPGSFSIHRTDSGEILGDRLGKGYTIVQNNEAFAFFDSITGAGEAMYETAGVLGKGERIFITAKMPNYIRIAGTDDVTEVYVLLTSSHDGSGSIIAAVTPVRVVCNNTLNMALRDTISKVAVRHSASVMENLEEAHKVLGIAHKFMDEVSQCFNVLAKKSVTDEQVKALIGELFKSEKEDSTRMNNIQDAVWTAYNVGIGQDKILGTAWGVLNGLTHYFDHDKNYRSATSKFMNLTEGDAVSKATQATAMLLAL